MNNREQVVILGAGGHAKVIVEILESRDDVLLAGYLSVSGETGPLCGVERLGDDSKLPALFGQGVRSAFVAIGDNTRRKERTDALGRIGYRVINAISPHASISRYASLGVGVAAMPGAVVNAAATLGDGVIVNTNASVDHDCVIGAFAHVGPGSALAAGVDVGEGVVLGTGTCVTPGIGIGAWTIVGAGSVVVRNLPGGVIAFGAPAKPRNGKRIERKHD
ncbi:MAG TPA: acetyltransferase [Bryobacteraceae bacterium]|nr:acetyltransferase [Bryobacteraceae bacterium]